MTRRFLVQGRVQGVGFRWFTLRAGRALGVTGYVRNLPDGTVEVLATGAAGALEQLAAQLARGPAGAHVTGVDLEDRAEEGSFRTFEVR